MKRIGLIFILMGITSFVFAQPAKLSDEKRKEFEAQKVAFFTQEMRLTPEEASVFWPLYNEMQLKVRVQGDKIRDLSRGKNRETKELTEQEAAKYIETLLASEKATQEIKKEYFDKLTKALSAKKVWLMVEAEQRFHRQLWKKMGKCPLPAQK